MLISRANSPHTRTAMAAPTSRPTKIPRVPSHQTPTIRANPTRRIASSALSKPNRLGKKSVDLIDEIHDLCPLLACESLVGQVEQFSIPVPLQEYIKSLHEAISLFGIVRGSGVTRRAVAKRRRRTAPWPVPLLRLSGFFGLGFGVDPLARSAAVLYKSFVFSSLPIGKVLVLPFAGGVSPPLPVVSLLFSASYPQDRRSYYLFFNYLFFNYML